MHDEEIVVAIGAMITGVFIIKIIAGALTRMICHWCDSSLKMRLVEAGMSATEIEQVIGAGRRRRRCANPKAPKKPKPDDYSYVS